MEKNIREKRTKTEIMRVAISLKTTPIFEVLVKDIRKNIVKVENIKAKNRK